MKRIVSGFACVWMCIASCQAQQNVSVRNPLSVERKTETVSILADKLKPALLGKSTQVKDVASGTTSPTQWIDFDSNGTPDELIFQIDIGARKEKKFVLEESSTKNNAPAKTTYSRFVPERTDDYAWENDLVAFRTYGPNAEQLIEEKKPGGTLSSGIDCWLKRVDYPIIDKWYKKNSDGGSYHQDSGEGLDNYHVGASRGCGGIGVWADDSLYVSRNFVSYKTISTGPISTVFEITYAPWKAKGITVRETKRISLDLGSQLSRVEVILQSDAPLPNVTAGITLHDKKGETKGDTKHGWFSHWEPLDDSELGTGIVVDPSIVQTFKDYRTTKKDLSQLYVIMKLNENRVVYYTGFGWKKAGRFANAAAWNAYLEDFANKMRAPLVVEVEN